jgi:RIO-like serine/threonine protein kinase
MTDISHNIELTDEEVKILRAILKYSLDYCPIESLSHELSITNDDVQDLIIKLEKLLG